MFIRKPIAYLVWTLLLFIVSCNNIFSQDYSGYWLGVTYPSSPTRAVYNYFANFTQTGTTLGGTAQTAAPGVVFGGLASVKGTTSSTKVLFKEYDQNGSMNTPMTCYWDISMTYDSVEESLKGTYTNILNLPYCTELGGGKVELYRIVLRSGTKYCKGSPINLVVTGKNIRWYDSDKKIKLLTTGNSYSPQISQTTTFYITQTLYNSESPTVPIKMDITEVVVSEKITSPNCGKKDGVIVLSATGSTGYQYSADGGLTYQASPTFSGLAANSYKISIKDAIGCTTAKTVEVKEAASPAISDVKVQDPTCGQTNGKLTISATGGTGSLQYSLDGTTFQANNVFDKLTGGNFTILVKDNNGCAATKQATLAKSIAPKIVATQPTPTTCGKDNGGISVKTVASNVQFSIDGTTFQSGAAFQNLKAGTYTIILKDAAGCTDNQTTTVGPSAGPQIIALAPSLVSCNAADGRLTIQATGNNLQYSLNAGTSRGINTFDKLTAGDYVVLIKDAANCTATRRITLSSDCQKTVFIPTGFTPNGDGVNDQLAVYFPFSTLKFNTIQVYNRWGTAIYGASNLILKSGDTLWNGLFDEKITSIGDYIVVAEVTFDDSSTHVFKQQVAILR